MPRLADVDLSLALSKKEEARRLQSAQLRLVLLRLSLGGQLSAGASLGPPVCIVFEGWDASGKGGCIKRLVAPLDPRHVRVAQFAAPTFDEKRHHFLSRFWPVLPGWGGMAVLDRSWYGRVLVERVEGFATTDQWGRAYDEIGGFERSLVAEGMILVKFWMHLSPEEQLRRFRARDEDPLKRWKLTGHARADVCPGRSLGGCRGRRQAVGARAGPGDHRRAHRARTGRPWPGRPTDT
jgi:polyphosphate kinase 2 (PPK2 family)